MRQVNVNVSPGVVFEDLEAANNIGHIVPELLKLQDGAEDDDELE